jgi:outer membrane protein assembly factor BamB
MDASSQCCPCTSPLVLNGILYMIANGGILTSVQVSNGTLGKVERLDGAVDNYWSSPVAAGDKIYLVAESGKVVVIKAGLNWQILAINDLDEQSYATPALSAGQIVIRTASSLRKFGVH